MTSNSKPPSSGSDTEAESNAGASRRVGKSAALLMVSILLSRVLGLVRDRVIAHQFGQGFETDVYNAAFTIPDLILYLIAGGALSSAFIPVFTDYLEQGKRNEAWRIFSMVVSMTILVVGGLVLIAECITPFLVYITNTGYSKEAIAATIPLTRILLPAQVFFFLGGLMMGTLQVKGNFWGQALGPIIYNIGIIIGGVWLQRYFGIAGLCWGALVSAFIGNVLLQWFLVRRMGGHFDPGALRKYWGHPGAKQVWRLMVPILLGLSLPQVSAIVNKWFASYLERGDQTALMNANRLMQVPLGVFAQAIGMAIFPTLALHVSRNDKKELRRTVNYGLRFTYFLTFPTSLLMIVLALPLVQLLLQTGKFDASAAETVSVALVYYAIGIFAWSTQSIVARVFYSLKDTKTPVIVGTLVTLFIFIPLNGILMHFMGFGGLALATSLAAIINTVITLTLLRYRLKGIEGGRLFLSVAKITVASMIMAAVCWLTRTVLQYRFPVIAGHSPTLPAAIVLIGSLLVSIGVYAALTLVFRMEEASVLRQIGRKAAKILRQAGRRLAKLARR